MIRLIKNLFKTTAQHSRYWKNRKIDWSQAYTSTWNHPHRQMLVELLKHLKWYSLFEVGCGSGPNLVKITKEFGGKQLGGNDVNKDAIDLALKTFKGGIFKVGSAQNIMMSDNSSDIVLSDMTLIYVSDIHTALNEMIRVARNYVILCELHTESKFQAFKLKLTSGYNAFNYKKLLAQHGLYDITLIKIPTEVWDGKPQKPFGYFILARVPKRKYDYHNFIARCYRSLRGY